MGATVSLLLAWAAVALAGDDTTRTSSIFAPVSEPADAALTAATLVLAITAGIFAVVGGLLAFSIVRFRRRPDDDGREPAQVYGSDQIELAWTVIPILIVVVLSLVTARTSTVASVSATLSIMDRTRCIASEVPISAPRCERSTSIRRRSE